MRKLASIQTITDLNPIEGKDRIELATVLGWRVIVQKGLYKIGDMCVYCEPDSVMPDKPEFEFLRDKKFKIKTMKMAGVFSEGIVLPLSILPKGTKIAGGADVTGIIGVRHVDEIEQETKEVNHKTFKGNPFIITLLKNPVTRPIGKLLMKRNSSARRKAERFPSFIRKTDEPRIQTIPFLTTKPMTYVCREKLDGSSMTVFLAKKKSRLFWKEDSYEFGVCSRNRRLLKGSHDSERFLSTAEKYKMEEALREIVGNNEWIVIQGELVGPGIQNNPHKLDELRFYAFNLIVPTGKIPCTVGEIILKGYGIPWVPMVGQLRTPMTVEEILTYATGNSALAPTELREGIVCRNYTAGISFKAVSTEYLIK